MTKQSKPIVFSTKLAAARSLGVNRNTFAAWSSRADFPGGGDGPWKLDEIVPWIVGRQQRRPAADDPLMDDATESPGLERYRQAKAAHAELDVAARQGELVDVAKLRAVHSRWAAILRRAGEQLQRRHGPDAARTLNNALGECRAAIDLELGAAQEGSAHAT